MKPRFNNLASAASLLAACFTLVLSIGVHAAEMQNRGHSAGHGMTTGGHGMKTDGHGMATTTHGGASVIGMPGKAADISRTVEIIITDNRYSTEALSVTKGETVRFVIRNKGELVHEFNIGTPKMHAVHQKHMEMMVDHGVIEADKINYARMKMDMGGGKTMEHKDPNSALLEPGKIGEIVWKFTKSADLEFACNVPGHYDAGMAGRLHVK